MCGCQQAAGGPGVRVVAIPLSGRSAHNRSGMMVRAQFQKIVNGRETRGRLFINNGVGMAQLQEAGGPVQSKMIVLNR